MTTVSIRELRLHAADLVDRVAAGERVVVTRRGRPVAELRPVLGARRRRRDHLGNLGQPD